MGKSESDMIGAGRERWRKSAPAAPEPVRLPTSNLRANCPRDSKLLKNKEKGQLGPRRARRSPGSNLPGGGASLPPFEMVTGEPPPDWRHSCGVQGEPSGP